MSLNRLRSDNIELYMRDHQNKKSADWLLDCTYLHSRPVARPNVGIVGGSNPSLIRGNLADLDSFMRGITQTATNCPELEYQRPQCFGNRATTSRPIGSPNDLQLRGCESDSITYKSRHNGKTVRIDTRLTHLPELEFINYGKIPRENQIMIRKHEAFY